MIGSILVPLDGSDNAKVALDVAADLSSKYDAQLTLLHVGLRQAGKRKALFEAAERAFEDAERAGDWTSDHPTWPRDLQILEYMGHMILNEGRDRAGARGAHVQEALIDWGDEGERILHYARRPGGDSPGADMIVMGSRGESPLQGLVLGSVSHKVFHLAPCSCVTVRSGEGQQGLEQLERVLVPFDGSDHAMKALELACDLAGKFGAQCRIIHVLQHDQSLEDILGVVDVEQLDDETRQALAGLKAAGERAMDTGFLLPTIPEPALRKLGEAVLWRAKQVAIAKGLVDVDCALRDGDPAEWILAEAKRGPDGLAADMIVMGMRGLGEMAGMLLGSVSYKIIHLAPCSCITVR